VLRAVNADGTIENALPSASTITVSVNAGTPSAEGPLKTVKAQSFTFTTYSAFKYSRSFCGWSDNPKCSPFRDWYIEFNNQIDAEKFTKELVKIEPAVDGLNIYPQETTFTFRVIKRSYRLQSHHRRWTHRHLWSDSSASR
jgi:hypothetical protein